MKDYIPPIIAMIDYIHPLLISDKYLLNFLHKRIPFSNKVNKIKDY